MASTNSWSEEDDFKLNSNVLFYGTNNWPAVAAALVGRTAQECMDRWKHINKVDKDLPLSFASIPEACQTTLQTFSQPGLKRRKLAMAQRPDSRDPRPPEQPSEFMDFSKLLQADLPFGLESEDSQTSPTAVIKDYMDAVSKLCDSLHPVAMDNMVEEIIRRNNHLAAYLKDPLGIKMAASAAGTGGQPHLAQRLPSSSSAVSTIPGDGSPGVRGQVVHHSLVAQQHPSRSPKTPTLPISTGQSLAAPEEPRPLGVPYSIPAFTQAQAANPLKQPLGQGLPQYSFHPVSAAAVSSPTAMGTFLDAGSAQVHAGVPVSVPNGMDMCVPLLGTAFASAQCSIPGFLPAPGVTGGGSSNGLAGLSAMGMDMGAHVVPDMSAATGMRSLTDDPSTLPPPTL